jgi:hypothetical protein
LLPTYGIAVRASLVSWLAAHLLLGLGRLHALPALLLRGRGALRLGLGRLLSRHVHLQQGGRL